MSAAWFVIGFGWGLLACVLALFAAAAFARAAEIAADDDVWGCDDCAAELEASIQRHPASRQSIQDPDTGRTWWA